MDISIEDDEFSTSFPNTFKMSRIWLDLRRKAIQIIPDVWYNLDENVHSPNLPSDIIWQDQDCRIYTRYEASFYLFYLLNGIRVSPQALTTTNIEEIPIDEIYRLTNFSLDGFFTKARILKIVDVNHVELAFFVSFDFFSKYQPLITPESKGITRRLIPNQGGHGFFIRERCILKNILRPVCEEVPLLDRGLKLQLGLELLGAWCNSLGNIVYVEFCREGESCYRPIILYTDIDRNIMINHELATCNHPSVGTLFPRVESEAPESFLYENFLNEENTF